MSTCWTQVALRSGRILETVLIVFCLAALSGGLFVCFTFAPEVKHDVFVPPSFAPPLKSDHSPAHIHPSIKHTKGSIMTTLLPQWLGIKPSASQKPQWDLEHWTPISISTFGKDPKFKMCKLNFKAYSAGGPHKLPMFKDLVGASQCSGRNSKMMRMSDIREEMRQEEASGKPGSAMLPPSGFVFHESRVGSTLVANLLGSDPFNMVFSESAPPASVLLHCGGCSHKDQVAIFRDTVLAMGRSPTHQRVFFKFQSITTTQMKVALEAFPDTPWVFLYRHPVQTMMSHMDPAKGGGRNANCLKSKRSPSNKYKEIMSRVGLTASGAPAEASCAAHLSMLCEHALEAYEEFGRYESDSERRRGLLLDYKFLPGAVPNVLLPHFGIAEAPVRWLHSMAKESLQYSKSSSRNFQRGKAGVFTGDSKDKEQRASAALDEWAEKILQPAYEQMNSLSLPVIQSLSGEEDLTAVSVIPGSEGVTAEWEETGDEVPPTFAYEPFKNTHNSTRYETILCPDNPADNYPATYDMKRLLDNWNPDETNIPPTHFDSLCHFDYQTEFSKALNYRNAEKPFVVYNVPEVDEVVRKWSDLDHLNDLLGAEKMHGAETSQDNHFMYWREVSKAKMLRIGFKPPTSHKSIKFVEWLKGAVQSNNKSLVDREHLYLRVNGKQRGDPIFNELPFFNPVKSLFIVEPSEQRGINCRFGMKSVIAESHYDGSRNYVASLGGMRRFILNHPNQCENLYLYPKGHPSARHSEIDWSKADYDKFPRFATAQANEIITRPGDVLYLPTYWFHYIISLNVNFQCNTRSGISSDYQKFINKCGF